MHSAAQCSVLSPGRLSVSSLCCICASSSPLSVCLRADPRSARCPSSCLQWTRQTQSSLSPTARGRCTRRLRGRLKEQRSGQTKEMLSAIIETDSVFKHVSSLPAPTGGWAGSKLLSTSSALSTSLLPLHLPPSRCCSRTVSTCKY